MQMDQLVGKAAVKETDKNVEIFVSLEKPLSMAITLHTPAVTKTAASAFPTKSDLVMTIDETLDGSTGVNRNLATHSQINAQVDLEAITLWLGTKKHKSTHTKRAYRREAFRFLAWSIHFRNKPISSLVMEDVQAFHEWLMNPVAHPEWTRLGWQLFKGPLSERSQNQAMSIIGLMFRWLVDTGYLIGNPFKAYDWAGSQSEEDDDDQEAAHFSKHDKSDDKSDDTLDHYIERPLLQWVIENIELIAPPSTATHGQRLGYERRRFIAIFLYWTGLRRSELATARMSRFERSQGLWDLRVKGKGRGKKLEKITVTRSAMAALVRYRQARGLPDIPSPTEKHLFVVATNNGQKGITDHYINSQLKVLLRDMHHALVEHAPTLVAENPHWPEMLTNATAHWMRHSLATHNREAGVSIEATADQLRHKSIDTTRKIYQHADTKTRRRELNKLEDLNEG